jgi:uncharacterized protein (DUF433 family)
MAAAAERITINAEPCGGRPYVRDMCTRGSDALELPAAGLSLEQILEELPDLKAEEITAALCLSTIRG